MPAAFDLVTIDVVDTVDAARFWTGALGLREIEREDDARWIALADEGGRRVLGLQRGAHRAGGIHLDLNCRAGEFVAEIERLVALGATLLSPPRTEPYGSIANLTDPEGNAFDLCAYNTEREWLGTTNPARMNRWLAT